MAVLVVSGNIGTTPTRIAGAHALQKSRRDSIRAVVVASGNIQLGPSGVTWGNGFNLASGDAYTETMDVGSLYAVCQTGTVSYQAIISGDLE